MPTSQRVGITPPSGSGPHKRRGAGDSCHSVVVMKLRKQEGEGRATCSSLVMRPPRPTWGLSVMPPLSFPPLSPYHAPFLVSGVAPKVLSRSGLLLSCDVARYSCRRRHGGYSTPP